MLDQPMLADLCISDLTKMDDWNCMDQIVSLYDRDEYSVPRIKRAIIRYLLNCSHPAGSRIKAGGELTDELSQAATEHIRDIRERDPLNVRLVQQFFTR